VYIVIIVGKDKINFLNISKIITENGRKKNNMEVSRILKNNLEDSKMLKNNMEVSRIIRRLLHTPLNKLKHYGNHNVSRSF